MLNKRILFRPVAMSWRVKVDDIFPAVGNGWHEDAGLLWQQRTYEHMVEYIRLWHTDPTVPRTDYRLVDNATGQLETFLHPR